ncbi:MAG: hydrolase [Acidobacteriota bacterium]
MTATQNQECCPRFDPEPWDDKVFQWEDKKFIKDKVFTLFHIPINFGKVITRMMNKVDQAGAQCPDWLCLSDHTSMLNMDIYLAVDEEVPDANNVTLSGKYFSKVYEGDFKETGKWCKDYEQITKEKGYSINKWFMWYTTCPECAKKYDRNYVAVIAEVK